MLHVGAADSPCTPWGVHPSADVRTCLFGRRGATRCRTLCPGLPTARSSCRPSGISPHAQATSLSICDRKNEDPFHFPISRSEDDSWPRCAWVLRKEVSAVLLRAGAARSCTGSSAGGGRTAGRGGRCWPRRSPGCTRTQSSRPAGFDGIVAWKTTRMCKSRVDIRSCQVHSRGTTRTGLPPPSPAGVASPRLSFALTGS